MAMPPRPGRVVLAVARSLGKLCPMSEEKVEVENVNVPGQVTRVDRAKYEDMRAAIEQVTPGTSPGLTAAEMKAAAIPLLSDTLFPEGKTSGWWQKTVQLDLEAKGLLVREPSKPLRWHKA